MEQLNVLDQNVRKEDIMDMVVLQMKIVFQEGNIIFKKIVVVILLHLQKFVLVKQKEQHVIQQNQLNVMKDIIALLKRKNVFIN